MSHVFDAAGRLTRVVDATATGTTITAFVTIGVLQMTLNNIAKDGTCEQLAEFLRSCASIDPEAMCNALSTVVMRKDVASTVLLLEHHAIPNCRPGEHMPPLHCAVEQNDCEMIELLLNHGADVNYADEDGFTPLHLAVDLEADTAWQRGETPSAELVRLLLKKGADPTAKDVEGRTPLDIANQYGFSLAIELLKGTGN